MSICQKLHKNMINKENSNFGNWHLLTWPLCKLIIFIDYWWAIKKHFVFLFWKKCLKEAQIPKFCIFGRYILYIKFCQKLHQNMINKENSNFGNWHLLTWPLLVEFTTKTIRDWENLLTYYLKLSSQSIQRKQPDQNWITNKIWCTKCTFQICKILEFVDLIEHKLYELTGERYRLRWASCFISFIQFKCIFLLLQTDHLYRLLMGLAQSGPHHHLIEN
jgi:hypothetical protein